MVERTLRKDAEERRQLILEKAAELFAEHGVENVSMRQIAREAGVGQGTVYRSYTNKGELCWDLIGESCIQNRDKMDRYLEEHPLQSLQERLTTILTYHMESVDNHLPTLVAIQADYNPDSEHSAAFYKEHYDSIHSVIAKLLQEYKELIPSAALDPVFTADAILSMLSAEVYLFLKAQRHYTFDDIKERMISTFVNPLFK
ncbi:TetR family transcriptional regulator [Paenibacillus taihuensis]|uniref:TetR family transcriptional regulator n=1 Tax=Paenibacillus taihuensis TaxID=1156355 RepID=A0A3D9QUW0_9BACL|nr:TetR/AcrR family transcriptional regulator [Paenibacillus taihuensis]REE67636.1 TetR family transcriptional regulator [Paenibacillus taihuensis]